ncbi:PIN domain-containing protein [Kribbella lupini]|uniref:PIN domain-containing protein n=1 Tax=Kribbella lupini TaxID=291602 RepID=A0ABN2BMP2_9ACTN
MAALDACVLIPPGVRDLLLSCAHESVFRPVWQDEILDEVRRNSVKLLIERSQLSEQEATAAVKHTVAQMRRAFPDACVPSELWIPLVSDMTCHQKDRHVLAVSVGAEATHLVTDNTRDFPVASRPAGLAVLKPDRFMLERMAAVPDLVLEAVEGMSNRMKHPRKTPAELAAYMANGQHLRRFGLQLGEKLAGA